MKRVLIVGGNGNIGYALSEACLARGYHVTCMNRGLSGPCPKDVELIVGHHHDLKNLKSKIAAETQDVIIDLVCFNLQDALTSREAFEGCGNFIQFSSVATYGRSLKHLPAREDDEQAPENSYGEGKLDADRYFLSEHFRNGFPVTIVKPTISYSERFGLLRQLGMDSQWLARVRAGLPILVSGDGNALHQFIHVNDVANAVLDLACEPRALGSVFNITPNEPIPWNAYHRTAMKVLGLEVEMIGVPASLLMIEAEQEGGALTDIFSHNSFFSNEKIVRMVGFSPSVSLEQGMSMVIDKMMERGNFPQLVANSWEDRIIKRYRNSSIKSANYQKIGQVPGREN